MKYTPDSLVLVYWEGEQYFYHPFISPCKCGSHDLDIDDASGSSHVIHCNQCDRDMSEPQIPSGNPWILLQEAWNNKLEDGSPEMELERLNHKIEELIEDKERLNSNIEKLMDIHKAREEDLREKNLRLTNMVDVLENRLNRYRDGKL